MADEEKKEEKPVEKPVEPPKEPPKVPIELTPSDTITEGFEPDEKKDDLND